MLHGFIQKTRFSLIKGYFQTYNTKTEKKITNPGFCALKTHLRPCAEFHTKYVFHNPTNSTMRIIYVCIFNNMRNIVAKKKSFSTKEGGLGGEPFN